MDDEIISEVYSRFIEGVYVVSGKRGDRLNALTCGWVMKCSFKPPLVVVAVGKTRFSHDIILHGGVFAVTILGEGQAKLGRHFGLQSGRDVDKFANVPCTVAKTGAPILTPCSAWLDCTLRHSYDAGDHTLFVGELVDAGVGELAPLLSRSDDYWGPSAKEEAK